MASLNPYVLIAAAIVAVVAALTLFFTKTKLGQQIWQNFTNFLSNAWNGLKSLASSVWSGIANTINNASNGVKTAWNGTTEFFSNLWNNIKSGAQT